MKSSKYGTSIVKQAQSMYATEGKGYRRIAAELCVPAATIACWCRGIQPRVAAQRTGRPPSHTAEQLERMALLARIGASVREMASDLGVSEQTVRNWLKKQQAQTRQSPSGQDQGFGSSDSKKEQNNVQIYSTSCLAERQA